MQILPKIKRRLSSRIFKIVLLACVLIAFGAVFASSREVSIFNFKTLFRNAGNLPMSEKIRDGIALLKASPPLAYTTGNGKDSGGILKQQIALAILDLNTGEVFEYRMWVSGEYIDPASNPLHVRVLWWNSFNSVYEIPNKKNLVVVANKYLVERKYLPEQASLHLVINAPRSRYTDMVYAPYSELLHAPDVMEAGKAYLAKHSDAAYEELRSDGVLSLASPGKLVVDATPKNLVKNIVLVEHIDPSWLALSDDGGKSLAERTLVLIGANQEWAYRYTNSPAGANGLAQFIRPTYDLLVERYPSAHLIKDYQLGMSDHTNAMKAVALLFDNDKKSIQDNLRKPQEVTSAMLAASYNGGPSRVIDSVNKSGNTWYQSSAFPNETANYIKKFNLIEALKLF